MTITEIKNYRDDNDNVIFYSGKGLSNVSVIFNGKNNKIYINELSKVNDTVFRFDCDNGVCNVDINSFTGYVRIGHGCKVEIGKGVTCTGKCYISTAEESSVLIGDDCMIATGVEIRSDDAHPIFDVVTGARVNVSKDIVIGDHVWIGAKATILLGSVIGNGSVVGLGSIVKNKFSNNVVLAGSPAKTIKKNIAWERPHLNLSKPFIKNDSSTVQKSIFWNETHCEDDNETFFQRFKKAWLIISGSKKN